MMLKQVKYCKNRITELEAELKELPDGQISSYFNGYNYSWRIKLPGQKRMYLPKKYRSLACQLAKKRAVTAQIADLNEEAEACAGYLSFCPGGGRLDQILKNRGIAELISEECGPVKKNAETWQRAEYEKNAKYPEKLTFSTVRGEKVRSKSEALIANLLLMLKIPYRYEQCHIIGGYRVYPDFTVLNADTGQEILIEHFGMMNDPDYARNTAAKIKAYITAGYIPYKNILFFFEGNDMPLDMEMIQFVFEKYLVCRS